MTIAGAMMLGNQVNGQSVRSEFNNISKIHSKKGGNTIMGDYDNYGVEGRMAENLQARSSFTNLGGITNNQGGSVTLGDGNIHQ